MRVSLSTYVSALGVEPMVGFAVRRFDTVVAAAKDRDAPAATCVMPTGGWR
jgi:hypothetical protein